MTTSTSSAHSIELTGLDGTNPLGFLTALGTLVVARAAGEASARLRWQQVQNWMPVLVDLTTDDRAWLCSVLVENLRGSEVSPDAAEKRDAAEKAYERTRTAAKKELAKIKNEKLKGQDRKAAIDARVRPLEEAAAAKRTARRAALKNAVPRPELALGKRIDCTADEYREHAVEFLQSAHGGERETVDLLAAFGSDACLDRTRGGADNPHIEATPFCFIRGSGHQNFLETVRKLLDQVTMESVAQALFEPWVYRDARLSMRWDPEEDKRYALSDTKPADEGALTVWMANLLAYRALVLFPCAPTQRGLGTTAWTTIDDGEAFTWPLWEFAAGTDLLRTLLQIEVLREPRPDRRALAARGIAAVFRARRIRFPPTGSSYKLNFSPARGLF